MIKFIAGMKKHFGITHGVNDYLNPLMTEVRRRPSIDIVALDEWLKEKFGDYKDGSTSMEDIIQEKFGAIAVEFVRENL